MVCVAVHLPDDFFSSACTVVQFFAPGWAWSRVEKRLDDLFPDVHTRTIVLDSLLKLELRHRIEILKQSNEITVAVLKELSGLGAHTFIVFPLTLPSGICPLQYLKGVDFVDSIG